MEPRQSRVLQYLVVDVEVSLTGVLGHNTTFLQQEVGNLASIRSSSSTELDLKVFPLWGAHKRTDIQVDNVHMSPVDHGHTAGKQVDSQICWSCCFGPSLHSQRPQAEGWTGE